MIELLRSLPGSEMYADAFDNISSTAENIHAVLLFAFSFGCCSHNNI